MRKILLALFYFTLSVVPGLGQEVVEISGGQTQKPILAAIGGSVDAPGAVLIVHDWYGLSLSMKAEIKRLGLKGYRAMAVDLYGGEIAENDKDADRLMKALDQGRAQAVIRAALDKLSANGRPIAIVGYSMGGSIALRAAIENADKVSAVAVIYGGGFDQFDNAMLVKSPPALIVAGSKDNWAFPALLELQNRMISLSNPLETFVYPNADHGFAQSLFAKGANFDMAAIAATRAVLDSFLAAHL